jgi:DNA-binding transcriptional LysR family regulator
MATDLNALQVFVKVVHAGSFTGAALALDMPKSTVSQRVSELEQRLGARLLQRTTRKLSLTDQGRIYYDHCLRIFADIEEADRAVTSLQERPCGLLRITVPASTQFLGPIFTAFLRRCGGVQLDIVCTDRVTDLVEESFDMAIRAGVLSDSTLMARKLGTVQFVLVASPSYLKKRGRPRSPESLAKHDCLVFSAGRHPTRSFRLTRGDEAREVSSKPTLSVNDLDVLQDAVVGGVGIAMLPTHRCADDLREGRLERVLPDWDAPSQPIHTLYPSGRHLSPKVKAMLDHLQQMKSAPWLSGDEHTPASGTDARPERTRSRVTRRSAKAPARPRRTRHPSAG